MGKIMSSVTVLMLLSVLASSAVAEDTGAVLRVATYNINWGNVRLPQVGEAIATSKADVVFLQETTAQSERFLRAKFRRQYAHMHFVGHQGRWAAERFGFLSKYPLTDLRFDPPRHGLFGSYHATCAFGDKRIQVVNVHLTPFVVRRGGGLGDLFKLLAKTEQTHAAEMRHATRRLDASLPTIVAGDFNSLSSFAAPKHLEELKFIDSLASVVKEADKSTTWRWPTRPVPLRLRIDYIFHSPHFKTQTAKVVDVTGSDHHLVVCELVGAMVKAKEKP